MEKKKLYLASVSYDGSSFDGWARQPKSFTVQGFIERTISSIFLIEKFRILASSRTDKGVHALDQHFTFSLPFEISLEKITSVLKNSLQDFVILNKLQKVPSSFHPLHDVRLKEYRYYINTSRNNIFLKNYCWNYGLNVNVSKFRKLLKVFEGEHDFFNFSYCRIRNREIKNTHKKVEKISVSKKGDCVVVKILAKGFLRYQIRAIIGESLENLRKSSGALEKLEEMLSSKSPQKYKKLAPAGGLYLWKINFQNGKKNA